MKRTIDQFRANLNVTGFDNMIFVVLGVVVVITRTLAFKLFIAKMSKLERNAKRKRDDSVECNVRPLRDQ